MEGLGQFFRASIISAPSFFSFEVWGFAAVLDVQIGPVMPMMLASWGVGSSKSGANPGTARQIRAAGSVCGCKDQCW